MLNAYGFDPSAASSLSWKVPFIEDMVLQSAVSYSILSITETWLKPYITDAQLSIEGFNIFRSDRLNRDRGGCCLYIRQSLIVSDHFTYDDDYCQIIGCSIENLRTLVFSVYRPDNTPHKKFDEAMNFVQSSVSTKDDTWNLLITGDFNFPNINWETLDVNKPGGDGCKKCAETLLRFMETNLLTQIIDQPTRFDKGGACNILDLIITNNTDLLREIEILPNSISDHELISVILSNEMKPLQTSVRHLKKNVDLENPSFSSLNFHKADFLKINEDLEKVQWDELKKDTSTEDFPIVFFDTILNICSNYTPLKKTSHLKRSKYHKACYSINRKRRKIKGRIKALKQINPFSRSIDSLCAKLIVLEKEAQEKILICKQNEEKKALDAIRSNSKYFYSYAKQKKSKQYSYWTFTGS